MKITSQIRFWATNPCSLNGTKKNKFNAKLVKLRVFEKPDVIFLAETWFGETYTLTVTNRIGKTEMAELEMLPFTLKKTS
jgi:hypothetical protein